ncbi:Cytokine receptor-like factor 3 [Homalodisca vitripennis]|nr:Cytokine receptor-like factor 3 [Homalodisca vitripennis]KAG8268326.1 Cytokine receptor-like factor 3 [Homalodisca vitripennis]
MCCSLPAVPNMEEVPAITFQLNLDSLQSSLVSSILSAGEVSRMGPVQITSVLEKPGALLVHWEEVGELRFLSSMPPVRYSWVFKNPTLTIEPAIGKQFGCQLRASVIFTGHTRQKRSRFGWGHCMAFLFNFLNIDEDGDIYDILAVISGEVSVHTSSLLSIGHPDIPEPPII